jgi:hypothetical protein
VKVSVVSSVGSAGRDLLSPRRNRLKSNFATAHRTKQPSTGGINAFPDIAARVVSGAAKSVSM